jgi:hypothetical protein
VDFDGAHSVHRYIYADESDTAKTDNQQASNPQQLLNSTSRRLHPHFGRSPEGSAVSILVSRSDAVQPCGNAPAECYLTPSWQHRGYEVWAIGGDRGHVAPPTPVTRIATRVSRAKQRTWGAEGACMLVLFSVRSVPCEVLSRARFLDVTCLVHLCICASMLLRITTGYMTLSLSFGVCACVMARVELNSA